jgi:hypothetical protein
MHQRYGGTVEVKYVERQPGNIVIRFTRRWGQSLADARTRAVYGCATQGFPASIRRKVNEVFNPVDIDRTVGDGRIGGAARHAGASGIRPIADTVGHLQNAKLRRDRALIEKVWRAPVNHMLRTKIIFAPCLTKVAVCRICTAQNSVASAFRTVSRIRVRQGAGHVDIPCAGKRHIFRFWAASLLSHLGCGPYPQ